MVSRETVGTAALCLGLVAVGAVAWWLGMRPTLVPDPASLGTLPVEIGGWEGSDVPMGSSVESVLRADYNLQRAYVDPEGDIIWVYVGYYGTARGGRPEHTPRGCYTGAGWGIEAAGTVLVDSALGFRVNEYRVEQDGRRRLVHFWYRSHRRTGLLGGLDQNVDRLLGRLSGGRADGALVRLSTPLVDSAQEDAARSRLVRFAEALDPLIGERWPDERLAADVASR